MGLLSPRALTMDGEKDQNPLSVGSELLSLQPIPVLLRLGGSFATADLVLDNENEPREASNNNIEAALFSDPNFGLDLDMCTNKFRLKVPKTNAVEEDLQQLLPLSMHSFRIEQLFQNLRVILFQAREFEK